MACLIERLEKCLCAWEDRWYLLDVLNKIYVARGKSPLYPREKAIVNAPNFRKKLLSIQHQSIQLGDFFPPTPQSREDLGLFLATLPVSIAGWCKASRRVYHISEDLQAILNATSLEGVTWEDISFPFLAYAVSLQQPVIDADGDRFDLILVHNYEFEEADGRIAPGLELRFFCQNGDRYQPLSKANRQNIFDRMRRKEWEHTAKLAVRFANQSNLIWGAHINLGGEHANQEITATAQRCFERCEAGLQSKMNKEAAITLWDSMIRIVVGMCLYLKTLPPKSPHQSEWRPVPRSGLPDPRAISNEAQVCTVSSCYKLTTEERIVLGLQGTREQRAAYELSCHFREGHWRRPPGLGHDPTASKTVHVRPCLVRKDRLREGELPGGSQEAM